MDVKREVVSPPVAALDVAQQGRPASTVVRGGAFMFVSGLTAVDVQTGKAFHGTTASETRVILTNLETLLEAAGSSLDKVVKVNVLLAQHAGGAEYERGLCPFLFRSAAGANRVRRPASRRRQGHHRMHGAGVTS